MKKNLLSVAIIATILCSCAPTQSTKMTTLLDSVSYSIGVDIGGTMANFGSDKSQLNTALIAKGIDDMIKNDTADLTTAQMQGIFENYFNKVKPAQMKEASDKAMEKLKKDNANAKVTESGLLYEIVEEGDAKVKPTAQDTVVIDYVGTFPDGKEFDSSIKRGTPAKFLLGQLIPGWIEGVQMIGKGGKIKLWVPFDLGYGSQRGDEFAQPLVFEIDLHDVVTAKK